MPKKSIISEKPLTPAKILAALADLPGWTFAGDALSKTFRFADFRMAMAFMVRASFEADAMDHHPEWTNVYDRVSILLNTHSAGGKVTAKDVELARRIEGIGLAKRSKG
jgi:4a-hydroxytetrahydrobiopterin dehydratase